MGLAVTGGGGVEGDIGMRSRAATVLAGNKGKRLWWDRVRQWRGWGHVRAEGLGQAGLGFGLRLEVDLRARPRCNKALVNVTSRGWVSAKDLPCVGVVGGG